MANVFVVSVLLALAFPLISQVVWSACVAPYPNSYARVGFSLCCDGTNFSAGQPISQMARCIPETTVINANRSIFATVLTDNYLGFGLPPSNSTQGPTVQGNLNVRVPGSTSPATLGIDVSATWFPIRVLGCLIASVNYSSLLIIGYESLPPRPFKVSDFFTASCYNGDFKDVKLQPARSVPKDPSYIYAPGSSVPYVTICPDGLILIGTPTCPSSSPTPHPTPTPTPSESLGAESPTSNLPSSFPSYSPSNVQTSDISPPISEPVSPAEEPVLASTPYDSMASVSPSEPTLDESPIDRVPSTTISSSLIPTSLANIVPSLTVSTTSPEDNVGNSSPQLSFSVFMILRFVYLFFELNE